MTNAGTGELMASDLFTVMDGYTASYRVSVDGTAVSGSASRARAGFPFVLLSVPDGSGRGTLAGRVAPPVSVRRLFCLRPATPLMDSADWVRLVTRVSTAAPPRRSACPLSGPGRLTEIGCYVAAPAPRADPVAREAVR